MERKDVLRLDSTKAWSAGTPGRSQTDCFAGKASGKKIIITINAKRTVTLSQIAAGALHKKFRVEFIVRLAEQLRHGRSYTTP